MPRRPLIVTDNRGSPRAHRSILPAATTLSLAGSEPVYVIADPKDVFRILFNLIHNAVGIARAAGITRRIALGLEQNGATVTIRIADDGPGLPEDVRARLFQRSRSMSAGSGHGLSIARELAERNGALLNLADTVRGTEFTIELWRRSRRRPIAEPRRPQRVECFEEITDKPRRAPAVDPLVVCRRVDCYVGNPPINMLGVEDRRGACSGVAVGVAGRAEGHYLRERNGVVMNAG